MRDFQAVRQSPILRSSRHPIHGAGDDAAGIHRAGEAATEAQELRLAGNGSMHHNGHGILQAPPTGIEPGPTCPYRGHARRSGT